MSVKTYKYNDTTQLSEHLNVQNFKCKCGKPHEIKIDDGLPTILEKAMVKLGADKIEVFSGYRCKAHDKAVGGRGTGSHTQGYAADTRYYKGGKIVNSKDVALRLEDLGHKKGIGYRCGGSDKGTHIDTKPRKWYGDEKYSNTKSCCKSFYEYFDIPKPSTKKFIQVQAKSGVWCRKGIGFKYKKYKVIPNLTICELLKKNAGSANGYKWDKVIFNDEVVYMPNKWNKIV